MVELLRAAVFHTPRNPFEVADSALEVWSDGGLLIDGERIAAVGDFGVVRRAHPDVVVRDLRGGFLLPGFVDTHVHYPQVRVLGGLGFGLLDWLEQCALPEEARMADTVHAAAIAGIFLKELAAHGTTTALVFGAHYAPAMRILFDQALGTGQRIISGLVLCDRLLLPELHISPDEAYRQSTDLIHSYHGKQGLAYAVTPRFALSVTEGMLEVCQTLLRENPGIFFQTHMNENRDEIAQVQEQFPWAADYLAVYEKYNLVSSRAVLAHNVHSSEAQLRRLGNHGATVAHCPSSNAALGSGLFGMRQHVAANVRVALGTDVGAGTGFGMLKEALQAYLMQQLSPDGFPLTPAHLLYLATKAGACALGLGNETGDLAAGHSADFVYLRPREASALQAIVKQADSEWHMLAALFTLSDAGCVRETWVRGRKVA